MIEKKIYLVGGAIRDKLMNKPIKDRDYVAVGCRESEFAHLKKVGKDFPVFIREDGSELALARVEKKISSGYNGFEVSTQDVSIEDDLKRRDITINSIAYDEQNDIYIDPYDGKNDIKNKILRHTSEAFIEDPIRVLRIARFRARLGYDWKIYKSTKVLIYSMRDELKSLQPDRVYKEILKVLELRDSHIFFETLFELGVLDVIFPSIYEMTTLKEGSMYHKEDTLFVHTMMVLKLLGDESATLKLTALYHDIAKPYCYRTYGNGAKHESRELVKPLIDMQIPTKIQNRVLFLIQNHIKISILDEMRASRIATFFEGFGKDRSLLIDLIKFFHADNMGRITDEPKESIDEKRILDTYDTISVYSPKEWIDSCENRPTGDKISQHIHAINIDYVKEIYQLQKEK
jgi:tRNA nucleotidyltransferase (CCA-adding enzyme)